MRKKIIALLLAAVMVCSLAACSGAGNSSDDSSDVKTEETGETEASADQEEEEEEEEESVKELLQIELTSDGKIPQAALDFPTYFEADFDRVMGEDNWWVQGKESHTIETDKTALNLIGGEEPNRYYTWDIYWYSNNNVKYGITVSSEYFLTNVVYGDKEPSDTSNKLAQCIIYELADAIIYNAFDGAESSLKSGTTLSTVLIEYDGNSSASFEWAEDADVFADKTLIFPQDWATFIKTETETVDADSELYYYDTTDSGESFSEMMDLIGDDLIFTYQIDLYNVGAVDDDASVPEDISTMVDNLVSSCDNLDCNMDILMRLYSGEDDTSSVYEILQSVNR